MKKYCLSNDWAVLAKPKCCIAVDVAWKGMGSGIGEYIVSSVGRYASALYASSEEPQAADIKAIKSSNIKNLAFMSSSQDMTIVNAP